MLLLRSSFFLEKISKSLPPVIIIKSNFTFFVDVSILKLGFLNIFFKK